MQTRIDLKAKRAAYHFDSALEMSEWIDRTPKTWTNADSSHAEGCDYRWDLNAGYDGACELARLGWIEGAERAQEALKAFAPQTPKPDTRTDVYGFRPHVPRFCAGAPDSMIRHTNVAENGSGRVLSLIVPINASAATDARYMANFGVGVAQYVNQLETDGTRVEVIGCFVNSWDRPSERSERDWRVTFSWVIKNADQPLDLAVMAFSVGHPAMFRRIGFALLERCAAPYHYAYAYSANAKAEDIINAPPGAVVLNGMKDANTCAKTPEKALEFIRAQIEKAIETREAGQ